MISKQPGKHGQITLDQFLPKPLTIRTEKFIKLCDLYIQVNKEYPESPSDVYDFIQDHKLPNDIKMFKFLPLRSISTYYWKWGNIQGDKARNE